MEYCPKCGSRIPPDANYCFACDTRIEQTADPQQPVPGDDTGQGHVQQESEPRTPHLTQCPHCGAPLPADADYCFACDTRLVQPTKPAEAGTTNPALREELPESGSRAGDLLQAVQCASCGSPISEHDLFCTACGTRVADHDRVTEQPTGKRRAFPIWAQAAIAAALVVAAGVLVWQSTHSTPSAVPATPTDAVSKEQTTQPSTEPLSATFSPSSLSLIGTPDEFTLVEQIEIRCPGVDGDSTWHVSDDSDWFGCQPASGSFKEGVGYFWVRVPIRNLDAGSYSGTVSVRLDESDTVVATMEVTLENPPTQDPESEAARDFWESAVYRGYWESGAQTDVREAVRAYEFPEYDHGKADVVYFKSVDIEFSPDVYPRPIARVHCEAQFVVMEDLDQTIRTRMTYYTDTMVILQVAPGPFSTSDNEWDVVDVYDYQA